MARTWELLAEQRQSEKRVADALALAEAIANGREPSQKKLLEGRRF
jgi:hypothetical protein